MPLSVSWQTMTRMRVGPSTQTNSVPCFNLGYSDCVPFVYIHIQVVVVVNRYNYRNLITILSAQIMMKEFFITDIPRGELVDSVRI